MNLYALRTQYGNPATIGDLIINHSVFCHTLEDVVRPAGVKVPNQTAIPAGRYSLVLTFSPHFQRVTPEIVGVTDFTGVRMHGGNTAADTEGCVLIAYHIVDAQTIQGTAESALTELLQSVREPHWLQIIDTYPYLTPNI